MTRVLAASLMIGVVVSAAVLMLYHQTPVFFRGAVRLEDLLHSALVLPTKGDLRFFLPVQYAFYTLMAFVSAWICLMLPRVFSRVAYLAGAVFLTFLISPALAFAGILFEPRSGRAHV